MKMVKELVAKAFRRDERGQTVIEYILVIVLVALALIIAFLAGGIEKGVSTVANEIGDELSAVNVPSP